MILDNHRGFWTRLASATAKRQAVGRGGEIRTRDHLHPMQEYNLLESSACGRTVRKKGDGTPADYIGFLRRVLDTFAALALTASCGAHAGDDWTTADTVRQGVFSVVLLADGAQTRWMVKHPDQARGCKSQTQVPCIQTYQSFAESNPILGEHPSVGKINVMIAASLMGHAAVSYVLPRGWREGWQYVWIGIEGGAVYHNYSIGLKINVK